MTLRRALAAGLGALGLALLAHGAWIPLKGGAAQVLLRAAWERSRLTGERVVAWPWADTWPVARLRASDQDVELLVLSGSTGATLAFGPGHHPASAPPTAPGNTVISGHRDTHFGFLRALAVGDALELESRAGARVRYRVSELRIVDERESWVLADTEAPMLTLITCYPFDAPLPGTTQRYVVRARVDPDRR